MKTDIIIPIKTNNERLPGKNTKKLCGYPLYAYLFNMLTELRNSLGTIYVDSSDDNILAIAEKWGFTPSVRPPEFNQNHITGDELIARVLDDMDCDAVGLLHVTTPFLSGATVSECISILKNSPETDSVLGVHAHFNRFWFQNRPVNHDPLKLVRTQELEPVYEEADFYFFRKTSFKKYGKRVCGRQTMVKVGNVEALDIDTLADFLYAEILIRQGVTSLR